MQFLTSSSRPCTRHSPSGWQYKPNNSLFSSVFLGVTEIILNFALSDIVFHKDSRKKQWKNWHEMHGPQMHDSERFAGIYWLDTRITLAIIWSITINYRPQTKFAKVKFSQVSVCPMGGVSRPRPKGVCLRGGCPGPGPRGGVSKHALRQTPPPPADGHCCGRYASHWNAFLLSDIF